jgi:hypothetical protein
MKRFNIFLASLALSIFALSPATAMADDELDVTMEVLDSIADIDGDVIVMEGPEDEGFAESDDAGNEHDGGDVAERDGEADEETNDERGLDDEFVAGVSGDDFTHDEDFESDEEEEHSEDESDFDEGDDIDIDEPDEEPMHDEEPMDDKEDDIASDDDMLDDVADADVEDEMDDDDADDDIEDDIADDVADNDIEDDVADGEVTDGI